MKKVREIGMTVALASVVMAVSGCGDDDYGKSVDIGRVSFCGTLMDGSTPIQGVASYDAVLIDKEHNVVLAYSGSSVINPQGEACTTLVLENYSTYYIYDNEVLNRFEVQALTATLSNGEVIHGAFLPEAKLTGVYLSTRGEFQRGVVPEDMGKLAILRALMKNAAGSVMSRALASEGDDVDSGRIEPVGGTTPDSAGAERAI